MRTPYDVAWSALNRLCHSQPYLTSDDLWDQFVTTIWSTPESEQEFAKTVGRVFSDARQADLIEGTKHKVRSKRKEARGRKIPMWRSKQYELPSPYENYADAELSRYLASYEQPEDETQGRLI